MGGASSGGGSVTGIIDVTRLARALKMNRRNVAHHVQVGNIPSFQLRPGGKRFIHLGTLRAQMPELWTALMDDDEFHSALEAELG